ncbi:MAG: hypothetical protein EAZ53_15865 [Bacteroidetes bacterium]|nr:MAG: hypothetical protein EAZ53_15865 [Bacteroidota bacterium]
MKKTIFYIAIVIQNVAFAQPQYNFDKPFLATSQLGFRPNSPKIITLMPGKEADKLPSEINFYIQNIGDRLKRKQNIPSQWDDKIFRWPFNISEGKLNEPITNYNSSNKTPIYSGKLKKITTDWGVFWQADFSGFERLGLYQIECEYGFTTPFQIAQNPYDRIERAYLEYLFAQRSGVEVPGIRAAENVDDGVLDTDSTYFMPVAGGWNDAGDWRKWLFLTLPNVEALGNVIKSGHQGFKQKAMDEMRWGNNFFHQMISDSGRCYEDVGAGFNRAGDFEKSWWNENHPGVTASGDGDNDNIPLNNKSRHVRSNYNPLVQYLFVKNMALASVALPYPDKNNCLVLADRAWKYGSKRKNDNRTIYLSEQILAGFELLVAGSPNVSKSYLASLVNQLLERQETGNGNLSGYFYEKDKSDGYRSIAFSSVAAMAILRFAELNLAGFEPLTQKCKSSISSYIDNYLLKDAATNAFGYTPYGIYTNPEFKENQKFRDAGNGKYVRSFIHVFSKNPIPHGCGAVVASQAYLLARAGFVFEKQNWKNHSEKLLQWIMGHNPQGLCLFYGVGFKHPVMASFLNYKIPEGTLVGYMGTPEDKPYEEASNAVEWSTQEVWDAPFYHLVNAVEFLKK